MLITHPSTLDIKTNISYKTFILIYELNTIDIYLKEDTIYKHLFGTIISEYGERLELSRSRLINSKGRRSRSTSVVDISALETCRVAQIFVSILKYLGLS